MSFKLTLVIIAALLVPMAAAEAATYTWVAAWDGGSGSYLGNWSIAADWNPGTVPGAADSVIFQAWNLNRGTVTLDGDQTVTAVTFGGNNVGCVDYYGTIPLTVAGTSTLTVTGAFTYGAFGITPFAPILAGVAPTVTHGALYLQNDGNNFLGTIDVAGGMLYANSDAGFGDAGNAITLGSAGMFGGIGVGNGAWYETNYMMLITPVARNITLAGNGGILGGKNNRFAEYSGTISGSGKLIVADGSGGGGASAWGWDYFDLMDGNNTGFTGGMVVANGGIGPGGTTKTRTNGNTGQPYTVNAGNLTNDVYGTGDIYIKCNGAIEIDSAANIGPSAKIYVNNTVTGGGLVVGMDADYMPSIDPSSTGTILLGSVVSTNIWNMLGSTTTPVGDGSSMWLSTLTYLTAHVGNSEGDYGGTSLAAMILNDPTHTYKIGGGYKTVLELGYGGWSDYGWGRSPGVLHNLDSGSTVCNVEVGKSGAEAAVSYGTYVRFLDINTYTGTTTVNRGATVMVMDYPGGCGIGSGGGDIYLNGPGYGVTDVDGYGSYISMDIRGLNNGGYMVTKGNVTFNGAVGICMQEGTTGSWNNPTGTSVAQVTVSGLTRTARSTLGLLGYTTNIGDTNELFFDGNAADVALTHNMVPAYYWNPRSSEFLTYGANGFMRLTYTDTANNVYNSLASTPSTGIAYTGAAAVATGGQTVYALRTTGALTSAAPTDVLTVGDGTNPAGVIFAAAAAHSANFAFGTSEGILYVASGASNTTISGTITGTSGITKSGAGTLILTADNQTAGLSGDVTVDQGYLQITDVNQLGSGRVVLNGGTLSVPVTNYTFSREINLGDSGGSVFCTDWKNATFNGGITGSGFLNFAMNNNYIQIGGTNTYSGGTYLGSGDRVQVLNGSSLGTGPVFMGTAGNSTDNAGAQDVLVLYGADNLAANRLVMLANDDCVQFRSALTYKVASLEGVGMIQLGYGAAATVQVGSNNLSTDYFGRILGWDTRYNSGLTKVGTGTLTLWGDNSYTGMTTVNNGTLVNNNYINGPVSIGPGGPGQTPVYDGTGTTMGNVGVSAGGTLQGSGMFKGYVYVHGGTANMTNALLSGGLILQGGSYSGTSTISGGPMTVSGGVFGGAHTISVNSVDIYGGVLGGTNTITASSVQVAGGTLDGNNTITAPGGVYTDRDDNWMGPAGTIQGSGTINGDVHIWTGSYNGTHSITGNVDIQDYWYFDTGSPADSTFAGAAGITGNVTLGSNNGSVGAVIFKGGHTIHGNLQVTPGNSQPVTIAPSNDGIIPSTLTVVGNVSLDSSTVLNYKLTTAGLSDGGGLNDFIDIKGSGNLILDGTLNITGSLPFHTGDYRLMNYTGSLTDNAVNIGTTPDSSLLYTVQAGGGHVDLIVNAAWLPGDVNHDGAVNSLDVDAIYRHFGGGSQWDVNGDGAVNQADVTFELTDAGIGLKTEYGDANLDHKVNFTDFQVLLDHWQATGGVWATGDFNGDTVVNFGDFQKLLDYWNPAGYGSSVPEPTALVLLGLGALGLIRRKK